MTHKFKKKKNDSLCVRITNISANAFLVPEEWTLRKEKLLEISYHPSQAPANNNTIYKKAYMQRHQPTKTKLFAKGGERELTPFWWALSTSLKGDKKPSLWIEWEWSSKTNFSLGWGTAKSSAAGERGERSKKTHSLTQLYAKVCSDVILLFEPPLFFFFLLEPCFLGISLSPIIGFFSTNWVLGRSRSKRSLYWVLGRSISFIIMGK